MAAALKTLAAARLTSIRASGELALEVALTESVSLLVSYDRATFDYRDLEIDSDAFSIGGGYRF